MARSQLSTPPLGKVRSPIRVCVVGPGTHFLSGITYYTYGLIAALAQTHDVSAILIRKLLPARFYPGRAHVGADLSNLRLADEVEVVDGIDWYWGREAWRALRLLRRQRPQVLVLQWWTAAALHTYLLLTLAAKLLGIAVVIEFHEVLDTGEDRLGWVRRYAASLGPWLFSMSTAFVVHSDHDQKLVEQRYHLGSERITQIPHAGYEHYRDTVRPTSSPLGRLLFFGVVRPFKGVEDLIDAIDILAAEGKSSEYQLTIVGETWEDWTLPDRKIAQSMARDRITRVDRYVTDSEASDFFSAADVVVLPYRRCSSSGPLHIAMALGLPVVTTNVGGLPEATGRYAGAILAEPADPRSLADAIRAAAAVKGQRFSGSPTWSDTAAAYSRLMEQLDSRGRRRNRRETRGAAERLP